MCNFFLARLGFTLLLFVFEFPEIHNLADRRRCIGRNLDQIETGLFCHLHGTRGRHDAGIFTIGPNQADLIVADAFVDAGAGVARRGRVVWSAGYGFDPSIVMPEDEPAS